MRVKVTAYLPDDFVEEHGDDSRYGITEAGWNELLDMTVDELYELTLEPEDR